MTATELIARLSALVAEHGDGPVSITDGHDDTELGTGEAAVVRGEDGEIVLDLTAE